MSGIDAQRGDGLEPGLEERFLAEDVETWVARLTAVGVGAHQVVMNSHSLMSIPWVKEQGLSITREHQEIGLITSCGPAPRLSRTPVRPGVPAPKPGADALEILEGIGMGGQFDDLVQRGIVRIDGVAAG
jgi:crotonobetainyl-CoA:carnitine CoA-transferase CaiB-like acyl-CoA transferase